MPDLDTPVARRRRPAPPRAGAAAACRRRSSPCQRRRRRVAALRVRRRARAGRARRTRSAPDAGLTIAFALVKGERTEWAVQKLVELGVDRIVPFVTERSVVRWDEARAAHQHERWQRVARAAAMQSRRPRLATVEPLRAFADIVTEGFAIADPAGSPPSLATLRSWSGRRAAGRTPNAAPAHLAWPRDHRPAERDSGGRGRCSSQRSS